MPAHLGQIIASTKATLPALLERRGELERRVEAAPPVPSFAGALRSGKTVGLIAEVKRRSPSAGTIRADLDPPAHARRYAEAGASAISVLTEGPHFGGSLADLEGVRAAVGVPVLRKDFILEEVQLLEALASGASAALLIVRILTPARLKDLLRFGHEAGLELLVETHTRAEIDVALAAGAAIVGVNSRDLDTFALDPDQAWALFAHVPPGPLAVAESAMESVADVRKAAEEGADAVLIGSALSRAADPAPLIRQIREVPRRGR